MPSKKKKYNARFPPARIKKIMQADEEVGKVAAVVPVIISRTLEIFVETLLKKSSQVTRARNARTLTPAHIKASINAESQFSFLREMVATIPDVQPLTDEDGNPIEGVTPSPSVQAFNSHPLSRPPPTRRSLSKTSTTSTRNTKKKGKFVKDEKSPVDLSVSLDDDELEDDEDDVDGEDDEGSSCDASTPVPFTASSKPSQAVTISSRKANAADLVDDDYDDV